MKRRRFLATAPVALLAACAAGRPRPPMLQLPMLRLAPAALGRSMSVVQRLSVQRLDQPEEPPQTVEVLMQIDDQRLQLAGFAFSQRVLTMGWDGQTLTTQRHPMLPAEVDAERMLRDITLAWWPAAAIAAALPADWRLEQAPGLRVLRNQGEATISLRYAAPEVEDPAGERRIELNNVVERYALTIESKVQS